MLTEFHIGIDDTDSRFGGCTTYTTSLLVEKLVARGLLLADFPWLVRLNPNIPWKTRGNGALAVHLQLDESRLDETKQIGLETVEESSDPSIPSTDPAIVFLEGRPADSLAEFSNKALHDVVRVREARKICRAVGAESHTFGGTRGIIGALAAIGYNFNGGQTFEVIAYRTKEYLGTQRRVDPESVKRMDEKFNGRTFNNVDPETGRVLISPHGPDPVLFGIRGEDPAVLLEAFREIKVGEPIERVMLFKTNHGTDAHVLVQKSVRDLAPHQSVVLVGKVESQPRLLRGGHVIFMVGDSSGLIDCAAYEPTSSLRKIAMQLFPGDMVRVSGGVRRGPGKRMTLNVEKLEVMRVAEDVRIEKPRCSTCDRSCESMGKGQGFRCRKCGFRYHRGSSRQVVRLRDFMMGVYIPPPRAQRHLTRPESRYGVRVESHPLFAGKLLREIGRSKFCRTTEV